MNNRVAVRNAIACAFCVYSPILANTCPSWLHYILPLVCLVCLYILMPFRFQPKYVRTGMLLGVVLLVILSCYRVRLMIGAVDAETGVLLCMLYFGLASPVVGMLASRLPYAAHLTVYSVTVAFAFWISFYSTTMLFGSIVIGTVVSSTCVATWLAMCMLFYYTGIRHVLPQYVLLTIAWIWGVCVAGIQLETIAVQDSMIAWFTSHGFLEEDFFKEYAAPLSKDKLSMLMAMLGIILSTAVTGYKAGCWLVAKITGTNVPQEDNHV